MRNRTDFRIRTLAALPLAALVACASNPSPDDPCAMPAPPVADWVSYDEGAFSLQLPPEYSRAEVQGIDSQVGRWEAPGKRVSYDLGAYANPLRRDDLNSFPGLVVCQESAGRETPRIIRYSPAEGGYAVSAHWSNLGGEVAGMPRALTIDGVVQDAEEQGELLAIIRSVELNALK